MVARRFGRAVRVYMRARARVCVHACEMLVSVVSHAHTSSQASKFGLIRAIVPALMRRGGEGGEVIRAAFLETVNSSFTDDRAASTRPALPAALQIAT